MTIAAEKQTALDWVENNRQILSDWHSTLAYAVRIYL